MDAIKAKFSAMTQSQEDTESPREDPVSARLEEGVPLLGKMMHTPRDSARKDTFAYACKEIKTKGIGSYSHEVYDDACLSLIDKAQNGKVLKYDHDSLLTPKSILSLSMSAFSQKPVLMTLAYCTTLCMLAAAGVFFLPRARKIDTEKFEAFASFLKVFIGFMLGTYVTGAFTRWWSSVTTFENFLSNVNLMMFMIHTIRGRSDWRIKVEKYCVCSGYILNAEIRSVHAVDDTGKTNMPELLDWLAENDFLAQEEANMLKSCNIGVCCRTRAIWSWIGELVSHPEVEEGMHVPPPLLVRTIVLCQSCIEQVELLKMNVSMQVPFMYAHLLSMLVHANNTLVALICGISLGSALNEVRMRSEQISGDRGMNGHSEVSSLEQLYGAGQQVGIQIVTVLLVPMCYVAFLHIAHMLCYPFGDQCYHLPTETFISRLHVDLQQMTGQREFFRQKHADWKAMEIEKAKQMAKDKLGDECEDDDEGDCDD